MNLSNIFAAAAKKFQEAPPIAKGLVIGTGAGLAAAALPVIGIVSGPAIGAAIGGYIGYKKSQ